MKLITLHEAQFFLSLLLRWFKPEFRHEKLEDLRRERAARIRFLQFKHQVGDILKVKFNNCDQDGRRVLIIGALRLLEIELGLIKALELADYEPVVLIMEDSPILKEYYGLAGVKNVHFWSDYYNPFAFTYDAESFLDRCGSLSELLNFQYEGARVGRISASTTMRLLASASLDLGSKNIRKILADQLAVCMSSTIAAQDVLQNVNPILALSIETGYSSKGVLFDLCLGFGIDVIRWHPAHRSNTLMLKRYSIENINDEPPSLSEKSWHLVSGMEWTDAHSEQLQKEFFESYSSRDWYGENGTQFYTHLLKSAEIKERIGIDSEKKSAFIFPHIFWDASFSYGDNLFYDYEQWFIKTVQAACLNKQVNWVIKIHPAHVGKSKDGGYYSEPAELTTLRKHINELPSHIFLLGVDSEICTYSLFDLMDYCVTVRGTIGIEAALRGIPVLTAGTGRYDHKGFTIDSETKEEYLEKIANIQEIEPLSLKRKELAERFAYGLFLLRPLPLTSMTLEFDKNNDPKNYFTKTQFKIHTKDDWINAADINLFARWVTNSRDKDFLTII